MWRGLLRLLFCGGRPLLGAKGGFCSPFAPNLLPERGAFNLIVLFFSLCNNSFLDRTERDPKPSLLRSFCPSSFPPGELGFFLFSFSHRHFIEHASCCLVHTFDNVAVYVHRSFYVCVP